MTAAEIVFGRIPRTHLSMVVPSMVDRMRDSLEQPESSAPRVFAQGDRVWVRDYRPNAEKWQPGVVQSCMGSGRWSSAEGACRSPDSSSSKMCPSVVRTSASGHW